MNGILYTGCAVFFLLFSYCMYSMKLEIDTLASKIASLEYRIERM